MKRRSFLKGLMASAGAVVLPVTTALKPAAAAKAGAAGFHYGWACVFAQKNNGITPADIAEKFRIPADQANALFKRMLDRGVLQSPGLDGRSRTTRHWEPWDKRGPASAPHTRKARQREQAKSDRLQHAFNAMMASVNRDCPTAP